MNKIPRTFKMAGITFDVIIKDNVKDGSLYGCFEDVTNTIYIAKRVQLEDEWYDVPEQNMINTFYHELFHVFHYYFNNETPEDEAQVYANFMTEFIQSKSE